VRSAEVLGIETSGLGRTDTVEILSIRDEWIRKELEKRVDEFTEDKPLMFAALTVGRRVDLI
jgi:hypothetical protein